MDKIAADFIDQLQKYTTIFGAAWFLVNTIFRVGLLKMAGKFYGDSLKEFTVS
jgi:hypothetical protein